MSIIRPFSFNFRGKNSRDDFGIMVKSYDFLMPQKRERKRQIPFRHGSHDYGARYYNDRILRLTCIWIPNVIRKMSRSDIREISYWLSEKGQISLSIEPDKYYVGSIYDSSEFEAHYINLIDAATITDISFELDFVCEPFAYGDSVSVDIKSGINPIQYKGTAESPTYIVLNNDNNFPMQNVQIVFTRRKN